MRAALPATIGEYHLVDFLGTGGMGEVYRAVHSKTGKIVAVKVLTAVSHTGSIVERFCNEARVQADLHHPNIAAFYDFGEFDGRPCIMMEYVEGQTLHERIQARGCLSLTEALPIFQAVVETLGYVHQQGILHRDIKPTNIKVTSVGVVKLLDFGIAKAEFTPELTTTGRYVGTLPYLSPEALTGKAVDARADLWSLGVLLYEMVTGKLPFTAATIDETITRISRAVFVPASALNATLPREVDTLISHCLRANPAERYQSARDLREDLRSLTAATFKPHRSMVTYQHPAPRPATVLAAAKAHWALLVAVVTLILTIAVSISMPKGGITITSDTGVGRDRSTGQFVSNETGTARSPGLDGSRERRVQVDVIEGSAEVYQDGQKMGSTPYTFTGTPGSRIRFILKRLEYKDREETVDVLENDQPYTYSMEKTAERQR